MSIPDHQLELLAPARDADIGIAAIQHGADAVYIGGPSFGARAHADNSAADIARLVRRAHRFNARIFVTLNTILRDDELEGARKLAWQMFDAGVDALIIQDMGLLEIDLPPIQLHASTQCDIRTPEKARFLQDVGLSQIVLARELNLDQIAAIRAQTHCTLECFVHGALCVAYSGQCYISHAHTGRSANRGDCSQACRLPYQVVDSVGRFVAHDKHVLSMKDNNQSANLGALVDAGVRSFKIEGRYKDMAYVKNITAHYRKLLDELIEAREGNFTAGPPQGEMRPLGGQRSTRSGKRGGQGIQPLGRSSSGSTTFTFTPDPNQNFNREFTDYFVHQRHIDVAALDTPKNPGVPLGYVTQVAADWVELQTDDSQAVLHNGDGLCYFDLQQELVGMALNTAKPVGKVGAGKWRVVPKDPVTELKDLRVGTALNRNRDMSWVRSLERHSSDRRIGVWVALDETPDGLALTLTDEEGHQGHATVVLDKMPAKAPAQAQAALREHLSKFGNSDFCLGASSEPVTLRLSQPWFVRASLLNPLRREALAQLEAARAGAYVRPPRAAPVEPPVPYPEDTLSYLANVHNTAARDFYARHGVKVIAAAYESHEEPGEVSLMVTKHCVRFSLSLCPKQAKGVTGVQGTVKAEPLTLVNGKEKLTLRFDCKPCEMHVVGRMRKSILQTAQVSEAGAPLRFYRTRPAIT